MSFNVLVTGASTLAGRSMVRELSCAWVKLLSCDCGRDAVAGRGRRWDFNVHRSDDPEFVGDIVTLCLQHDIDVVVPMRASDMAAISRARQLFEGIGAKLWLEADPARATPNQARRILQLRDRNSGCQMVARWFSQLSNRSDDDTATRLLRRAADDTQPRI